MSNPSLSLTSLWNPKKNLRYLITRPQNNQPTLDGFRAISILGIIAFHVIFFASDVLPGEQFSNILLNPVFSLAWQGHFGVDIFFTLSGFLIGSILFKEISNEGRVPLGRFYFRRALRILPAYFVALIILGLTSTQNIENSWANILYVNNFLSYKDQFMGWAWSLAIEEQFYLLFPLFLIAFLRKSTWILPALITLFLFSFLIRWISLNLNMINPPDLYFPAYSPVEFAHSFDAIYDKLHTRYGGLIFGCIIAYLVTNTEIVRRLNEKPLLRWFLIIISFLLILIAFCRLVIFPNTEHVEAFRLFMASYRNGVSIAVGLIILVTLTNNGRKSLTGKILSARIWYPIAQLSYSAYLLHVIVITFLLPYIYGSGVPSPGTIWLYIIGIQVLTLSLSIVMYLVVERPLMNLRTPLALRWKNRKERTDDKNNLETLVS